MTCLIKDGNKSCPQLFLEHALYVKETLCKACKKDISKELMLVAWYPIRWWDWCKPKYEKKGINQYLLIKLLHKHNKN